MSEIPQISTPNQMFVLDYYQLSGSFDKITSIVKKIVTGTSNIKPFEFNFEFSYLNSDEFRTNIKEISKALEEFALKTPKNLESYVDSLERRTKEYHEMMDKIKSYPLKSITNQIKKEAKQKGVDDKKIKKFLKEVNRAVINVVITFSKDFEEQAIQKICKNELEKINVDYFLQNPGLQILDTNKYKIYKELIKRAFLAYSQDFKAYINKENTCFKVIEKLFAMLMDKMEIIDQQYNSIATATTQTPAINKNKGEYPTHIFKNWNAFQLFTEYANCTTKSEDIGFAFRQMSEKESLQLIVAKETVFRDWFNNNSSHELELKSPIKTLARFGNTTTKQNIYNLIKEKYFPNQDNGNKAA